MPADWTHDAQRHAQEAAAAKLLTAVKGGQSLADAAAVAGVTVRRTPLVTRGGAAEGMPPQLEQPLFGLKPGEPTMVETGDGFIVAVPARDRRGRSEGRSDRLRAGARRRCSRSIGSDVASVFADALRERAQPRINQSDPGQHHRSAAMNVAVPPGFAAFRSAYDAGRGTLVWRRGVADLETPVAAFLKLAHGKPNSFLLESVEGGAARGRYSIIGMEPDLIWRCRDGRAEVNRHAQSAPHAFVAEPRPALDSLRALIAETRLEVPAQSAADGGRAGRLSRLRHGPADGAAAGEEPRRDRRAGGADDPADAVRDLRQRERRADAGRAGLSAGRRDRRGGVGAGAGAARARRRRRWSGRCRIRRRR